MSARDAIMDEIKTAPEPLVLQVYDFVLFLKRRRELDLGTGMAHEPAATPDFLARQKALFGNRVLPDSQGLLDELRADRF